MKRDAGFSFLELVIAVALVAILLAIALPRHQEALVRSRVSRVRADLRELGVAMEAYAIDNAANYPFDVDPRGWAWYVTDILTTPISYLPGNSIPLDPFRAYTPNLHWRYRLLNYPAEYNPGWPPCYLPAAPAGPYHTRWFTVIDSDVDKGIQAYGMWKLSSVGPDKTSTVPNFFYSNLIYDPTNGTVSAGDIIRSQKTGQR